MQLGSTPHFGSCDASRHRKSSCAARTICQEEKQILGTVASIADTTVPLCANAQGGYTGAACNPPSVC